LDGDRNVQAVVLTLLARYQNGCATSQPTSIEGSRCILGLRSRYGAWPGPSIFLRRGHHHVLASMMYAATSHFCLPVLGVKMPVRFEVRRPPNRRTRRAAKADEAIPGTTDCCPKCKSPRVHLHANHDIKFYGRQLAICTNCLMGAARQGPDLGPFGPVRFAARAVRQLCVPAGLARAGRHRDVERTHRQASRRRHLPLP
jgi:hypothetical protein